MIYFHTAFFVFKQTAMMLCD